jgi:hypothetical protein
MSELIPDTTRQASHIFRGYNYQAYQTILAWLKCDENEEILTEFAEDVDLVRRDANGKVTEAELTQVKNENKSITLNSTSAKDLVNNYFKHKYKNPNITLFVRLCSVSDRTNEKGIDWIYADNGLDLWDLVKSRRLLKIDQEKAIDLLREFYSDKSELAKEFTEFLEHSNKESFLEEFIDRISWDTGQPSYTEIEKDIKQILARRQRPIIEAMEVKQIIQRLWYFVTHHIANEPGKRLNKSGIETLLLEETTVGIDRETLKSLSINSKKTNENIDDIKTLLNKTIKTQANTLITNPTSLELIERQTYPSNLPPLPTPYAERSKELSFIQENLKDSNLLWIHGSTGYGKTTIANLFSRQSSNNVLWFRLRNYSDFTLTAALQSICNLICDKLDTIDIIVLDDLSIIDQQTNTIELLSILLNYAIEHHTKMVVTSLYKMPSRLKAFIGDQFFEFVAPEMTDIDIKMLLKRSGLSDEKFLKFWSAYIYASTSGHPQLVSAYTIYAKENQWKFTTDMLGQQPRSVDEVKTESSKLLIETIKNKDARELVKYLSLSAVAFDRDFALSIGTTAPNIEDPGRSVSEFMSQKLDIIRLHGIEAEKG